MEGERSRLRALQGQLGLLVLTLKPHDLLSELALQRLPLRPLTVHGGQQLGPALLCLGEAQQLPLVVLYATFVGACVLVHGLAERGDPDGPAFDRLNGGTGWESCVYKNHQVQIKGEVGLAMGTYDFTCATTGEVSTVEYTFGYTRCDDGKVRIFLHHSSMPYKPQKKAAVGVAVPVPATRRDGSPVKASPVVPAVEGKLAEPDGGWR